MSRSRKSLCQTPVQKTTLLRFFERTPASVNKQQHGDSNVNGEHQTFSTPLQTSSSTPLVFKGTPREIPCPACFKSVRYYKLNEHLDSADCTPAEVIECKKTNKVDTSSCASPIKIHVKTDSITSLCLLPETQTPVNNKNDASPEIKVKKHLEHFQNSSLKFNLKSPTKSISVSGEINNIKQRSHTSPKKSYSVEVDPKFSSVLSDSKLLIKNEKNRDSTVKKKLFFQDTSSVESLESLTSAKRKFAVPYYLETFSFLIKAAYNEPLYQHLFVTEDSEAFNKFFSLSLDAQKLYVRLFSRKFQWRRRSKIVYDDIAADLSPLLSELCKAGFLLDISELNELEIFMKLLYQPELKELFKELKIPFNGKGNALEILNKHCRSQRSLISSTQSLMDRILSKIKRQFVTECYILHEEIRRIFLRFIMLSTLHHRQEDEEEKGQQQQSFIMLKVTIGEKKFPSYQIKRQRKIFKDRESLLRYGEAVILESQVRENFDYKKWEAVIELTNPIEETLFDDHHKTYGADDLHLPHFLRRFTAGSVYVYMFNKRIEALQSKKMYKEAVDLLEKLIQQNVYLLTHRGHWYERLALNLEQHLKDPSRAMEKISHGLNDVWVSPSHKLALSQRAIRISQSAKWRLKTSISDLPLLTPSEPRSVVITGRSLPRDLPGRKSVFIRGDSQVNMHDGDITLCSVEELVLQHYMENGYTHGVHGEGSTLWTVVGLLFWNVIYSSEVSDVFLSPFQVFPLDFDSVDFYESRKEIIEQRLNAIRNWTSSDLVAQVADVWNNNHGQTSLVSWDRFSDLDHVSGLVECIPPQSLAAISERLLRNYRHYRSGFPDLTVWNPQEKKIRIVEVKGPNDRLSTKQILWLDFLVSLGLDAEVCYVEAVGTKRMVTTPQVSSKGRSILSPESEKEESKEVLVDKCVTPRTTRKGKNLRTPESDEKQFEEVKGKNKETVPRLTRKSKSARSPENEETEHSARKSRRKRAKTDSA